MRSSNNIGHDYSRSVNNQFERVNNNVTRTYLDKNHSVNNNTNISINNNKKYNTDTRKTINAISVNIVFNNNNKNNTSINNTSVLNANNNTNLFNSE